MTVEQTPNPQAKEAREIKILVSHVVDELESNNPAWRATLPQGVRDTIDRIKARRGAP